MNLLERLSYAWWYIKGFKCLDCGRRVFDRSNKTGLCPKCIAARMQGINTSNLPEWESLGSK